MQIYVAVVKMVEESRMPIKTRNQSHMRTGTALLNLRFRIPSITTYTHTKKDPFADFLHWAKGKRSSKPFVETKNQSSK